MDLSALSLELCDSGLSSSYLVAAARPHVSALTSNNPSHTLFCEKSERIDRTAWTRMPTKALAQRRALNIRLAAQVMYAI